DSTQEPCLGQKRAYVAPGCVSYTTAAGERCVGLASDRDTGVHAAELRHRNTASANLRIHHVDAATSQAFEDDKVVERPVEYGSRWQQVQFVQVGVHPASDQSVVPGRLDNSERVDAAATGPGHVADFAKGCWLAEVPEDHRQAGGATIGEL